MPHNHQGGRHIHEEEPPSGRAVSEAAPRDGEIEALRAEPAFTQEHRRALFERNVAGVYLAEVSGQILDLNNACVRIFGCSSREEGMGCSLRRLIGSDEEYDRFMGPLLERRHIENLELQLRRSNGELFWVLTHASILDGPSGKQPLIEGTLIDITRLKQAEEALRHSENRFRALVENSTDAISLVDETGTVLYSSHAVSPIFGYSLEERAGRNIFELVHPEDRKQTLPLFQKLLTQGLGSSVSTVIRYLHKNGSWRWIEALGTNLLEDPSVHAVAINYRDITDRRLLQQQFYQAQKMEAVGQLAGGVAHDFNNLLTAILGYSDMALEKLPRNSQARRYTAEIKKAGERAAVLTRQLLAFSRLQVMSPQVIDLNASIAEMGKMLRRLAGEDITVTTTFGATPGRIKADPAQIEQVIMNLAVNARDAMPQGGRFGITTSDAILEGSVTAEGIRVNGGHYVLMEVSDTGCGMDPGTRARIFDPFFTTKERGKGTGLGLSTVYGVVKQSGGYIWVASEAGAGAKFSIYLPAVEEDLSAARPAGTRVHKYHGSETVLVVEDENPVRVVLGKILRGMGYQVIEAARGDEALELCRNRTNKIHLLLTDMAMPHMKGQELARLLAEIHPETKTLFMTGYAGNKVGAMDVLESGAHFLSKPFTAEGLGQKVRQILNSPA
ncbi:MAG: PAS domain S-box protein [Terriglobia bacterium]